MWQKATGTKAKQNVNKTSNEYQSIIDEVTIKSKKTVIHAMKLYVTLAMKK